MNKVVFFITGFFICWPTSLPLQAEEEQIPPPTAPFVQRPPAHATWKVIYTPKKQTPLPNAAAAGTNSTVAPVSPGPLPLDLVEVDVVKMDPNRRDIYFWSDKKTTEHWIYNGLYLFEQPGMPGVNIFASGTGSMAIASIIPDYSKSDFPEFGWLSLNTYRNVVTYQQRKCYLFQSQPLQKNPGSPVNQASSGGQQAWIDVKTLLPVAFDDGTTLRTYASFKELPPGDLVLPSTFAQELHNWQGPRSVGNGHPGKP